MNNKISFLDKIIRPKQLIRSLRYRIAPIGAKKAPNQYYTYSDLFIWRCDEEWKTYCSIIPYIDLITQKVTRKDKTHYRSYLLVLSSNGNLIKSKQINTLSLNTNKILINSFLSDCNIPSKHGTFLVFHELQENYEELEDGYITDRGYVSYQYGQNKICSTIHGNTDAVACLANKAQLNNCIKMRPAILNRKLDLQFRLESGKQYEMAFSNPTNRKIDFKLIVIRNNKKLDIIKFSIDSLGSYIHKFKDHSHNSRVRVISKHPFPRPILFIRNQYGGQDVLHA